MKWKPKFRVGQRVILPADASEGIPEERGEVTKVEEKYKGMYIVTVNKPAERGDDRIREVHEDNMKEEK